MQTKNNFVHESSYIDDDVTIGDGTKIWHYCHIMSAARIGKGCIIGQNVFIGHNVTIEDGVKVQNNVSIYEGVTCEKNVFIGPSVVFTNVKNPRSFIKRKSKFLKTSIKEGASIGANVTIVCGVEIGAYALISAGAVITKDIPAHALAIGNPCQIIGWVSHAADRLTFLDGKATCSIEGRSYCLINDQLQEIFD
jgi:UDP-2-acetamido-3-amino-2,3-dideoxy-glucuronate N-acetyltransferase